MAPVQNISRKSREVDGVFFHRYLILALVNDLFREFI